MRIPVDDAHIGGFEMEQCQQVIDLCGGSEDEGAA